MVEITATLLNGSTFFTNESIECLITLSCPAKPELEVAQGSRYVHFIIKDKYLIIMFD